MASSVSSSVSSPASNSSTTQPALARDRARTLAQEAGFTEAGLVALPYAEQARDADRYKEWIEAGRAGTMRYLERRDEDGRLVRAQTANPFPWARSAIVCFTQYQSQKIRSVGPAPEGTGWIARYAWSSRIHPDGVRRPSDYHKVLLKRLKALDAKLHAEFGNFESRAYVDTGPVVERSLAVAAGLGWTGKNTCLIHPKLGSCGFLAVLLTSLDVHPEDQRLDVPDRCGSCTRCIEACPTDALIEPYQMDATRCIAYLTIEHQGEIPEHLMGGIGRQVFGCDICQDVCPWNRKAPITADPDFESRPELINPTLEWLSSLDERSFEQQFNGSPVRRTGFWGLRRNVAIAMGNAGRQQFRPRLEEWASVADEGLRAAARWALGRLRITADPNEHAGGRAPQPPSSYP
jgi:epoxyqueuosine reductase